MDRYIEFALNHYLLVLALAVVTYLLIQEIFDGALNKSRGISPLLAVAKMNADENIMMIDVRDPPDFVISHIEQATNLPLDKVTTLSADKDKPVIIVCQNGTRSADAAKRLTKEGFSQLFVITGGMAAWEEDYKLPVKLKGKK
jgi:rhodanese-related sulfurtransferase